jgi:hypothetical protein
MIIIYEAIGENVYDYDCVIYLFGHTSFISLLFTILCIIDNPIHFGFGY